MNETFDLLILGGGPGGYVAALRAAQLGARVAVVEKDRLGGTCLNIGCIPTKALTTSAELLFNARRASDFGIFIESVSADLPSMMAYKREVVEKLVGGVEFLLAERSVRIIKGEARVAAPNRLSVIRADGPSIEVQAPRLILAPGSVTARPPIPGLDLPGVLTSTEALEITEVPPHLIVIGGGVIGLEFACIYEALGSQVTVLEMMPTILPAGTDESMSKRLALILRRRGLAIHTHATVQSIEFQDDRLSVTWNGNKGEESVQGDRVLVATGRWPNTANLDLERAGIRLNGRAIEVDSYLQTNLPEVWAVGDAVGGWMLAHKAMMEGRVAAENALGGKRMVDYRSVPNVIFTRPEVASVGLTEIQAKEQALDVKITQFPFAANPKASILRETEGLVKLVCEAGSGKVLGMHILGPHATDLIAEAALAVQVGASAEDLAWTTHAHPTLPEAMLEAALGFSTAAIHFHTR